MKTLLRLLCLTLTLALALALAAGCQGRPAGGGLPGEEGAANGEAAGADLLHSYQVEATPLDLAGYDDIRQFALAGDGTLYVLVMDHMDEQTKSAALLRFSPQGELTATLACVR